MTLELLLFGVVLACFFIFSKRWSTQNNIFHSCEGRACVYNNLPSLLFECFIKLIQTLQNTCPTNGHNQKQMYIQTETITFRQENTQSSNTTNTTPNFYNCFRSQHTVCVCHTHKHIYTKTQKNKLL